MRRGSIVGWLGAVTAALLLSACGSGTTTMESMANSPSAEGTRSQDATAEADRPAAAPTPAPAGGRPAAAAVPVAADYLWVLTSSGGRVEGVGSDSEGEWLTLVMTGVNEYATQFTDRPDRHAYVLPTEQFAQLWPEWFADAAPNSVLAFEDDSTDTPRTVVFELFDPVYSATDATLTFRAQHLHSQPAAYPGAEAPQPPPVVPPETFTSASLFVDPANVGPTMYGMGVGYLVQSSQTDYSSIPDAFFDQMMATIAPYTQWVTNYGLAGSFDVALVEAAHKAGLKVAVTPEVVWNATGPLPGNAAQVQKAIELVNDGVADAVVVGNELNLKFPNPNGYPYASWANDMVGYLAQVKSGTGGTVPVGVSFAANVVVAGGEEAFQRVNGAADFVQVTIHPANNAYNGVPGPDGKLITTTDGGAAFLADSYAIARKQLDAWGLSGTELQIRETGWPTSADSGRPIDSLFTVANAADYQRKALAWASANNVKLYWFMSVDEPRKGPAANGEFDPKNFEATWGIWHFTANNPATFFDGPGPWGTFDRKY